MRDRQTLPRLVFVLGALVKLEISAVFSLCINGLFQVDFLLDLATILGVILIAQELEF